MRKILFIDDEANIANNLQWNLEHSGNFDVIFLQDYRQIDIELQKGYDGIILDVMMPILENYFSEEEKVNIDFGIKTGLILFDKIRKQYPRMPVVFYTAIRDRIGCDECSIVINKPELAQVIAKTLNDLIERVSN